MRRVLGFSGRIGSGKSSLVDILAAKLSASKVGFGDFVRAEATRLGLGSDRGTLQELGQSLVARDIEVFCEQVLDQCLGWRAEELLLVDGIRHMEVLECLRKLAAPAETKLILVEASRELRQAREIERGSSLSEAIEAHVTEVQAGTILRENADLVVDGSLSLEETSELVLKWVQALPQA